MKIKVFGSLRAVVSDRKEIELAVAEGMRVHDVLEQLAAVHPELHAKLFDDRGGLGGGVHVLVNGRSIRFLQGPQTRLKSDDVLALFPPLGGG